MPFDSRNLIARLDRSRLSDAEIAAAVGCTRMTVWRWRHGRCPPTLEQFPPLARVLRVSIKTLIQFTKENES